MILIVVVHAFKIEYYLLGNVLLDILFVLKIYYILCIAVGKIKKIKKLVKERLLLMGKND
jgi:hypothetical protein